MMRITRASVKAYRYACMNYHYAKAIPSVSYAYNVYQNEEWCGCIIFGSGANNHIGKEFGLVQGEILELVRVALNGKQRITSECLAATLRQLHKDAPAVKMIVSYADADQEHLGIIYQATNWIYLGRKNIGTIGAYMVNGKRMHPRSVNAKGWKNNIDWIQKNIDSNAEALYTKGKRKYIMCFDKKLRKIWQKQSLPYPKDKVMD